MEEHRPGIGAGSSKSKVRSKTIQEQRRQEERNTEKSRKKKQEDMKEMDFGDGSTIEKDWSSEYGMVCKVIRQRRAICWSRVLTCLVEAAFNKNRPPQETYQFSHEELVQTIKADHTSVFEVGSINQALKRIQTKGLVKVNSRNSWDEDGFRAKWKFEVKSNGNSALIKEKLLLSPVGIIMDVDSEFLDGTGKELYTVRVIGSKAERHALIITGYGRTNNGQFFFICQNSWGLKWGYNGLGRLIVDDQCHIFTFYPIGDQLLG